MHEIKADILKEVKEEFSPREMTSARVLNADFNLNTEDNGPNDAKL